MHSRNRAHRRWSCSDWNIWGCSSLFSPRETPADAICVQSFLKSRTLSTSWSASTPAPPLSSTSPSFPSPSPSSSPSPTLPNGLSSVDSASWTRTTAPPLPPPLSLPALATSYGARPLDDSQDLDPRTITTRILHLRFSRRARKDDTARSKRRRRGRATRRQR